MNIQHDRVNNFDAIRLLGAILVLVGHGYVLLGREDSNPSIWGTHIQTAGLILFFSLSGYLIATSWKLDPRLLPYLKKRALRIFPALIIVTLASMFILGPTLSRLSVLEYFSNSNLWPYLKNIILSPVYALPGVFEFVPFPNAVNGSLWSLPAEFACYLLVPLVALLPTRFRSFAFLLMGISSGVVSAYLSSNELRVVVYGTDVAQATSVWPYFMIGAAIAYAGRSIPLRLDIALAALVAGTLFSSIFPDEQRYIWWIILPYAVICFGSAQTPVLRRAGRFGDISYGLYLYSFPVQQSLIVIFPSLVFPISLLLTLAISAGLGFASWHLIEKQALRFKPKNHRQTTTQTDAQRAR